MHAVDGREDIGSARDEVDARAHRKRVPPARLGEIVADVIERREQPELLVNELREPVTGDFERS